MSKCLICCGETSHEDYCSRKYAKAEVRGGLTVAHCQAERYPDDPRVLDTSVKLEIESFCITWDDKEKLIEEIESVIAKYLI